MSFKQAMMNPAQGNQVLSASVGEILDLQKALQHNRDLVAKSNVGYPAQGTGYAGALAPLVPQSIQNSLDSATLTKEDLVLFPMLRQVMATSPLHETTVINEHGNGYLDPFIAESGVGPVNVANYERLIVNVKYLAEHAQLSDVSMLCGILGKNSNSMLAERTERGTLSLLEKLERQLVHGDSSLTPLAFDGILRQMELKAPENVRDFKGQVVTPEDLVKEIAFAQNDPNFGRPSIVLMDHEAHAALSAIAITHGRGNQFKVGQSTIQWGSRDMEVVQGGYRIPIKTMPLIRLLQKPNTTALGTEPTALATYSPTIAAQTGVTGSKFGAGDAGAYRYKITGVSDQGVTAPFTFSATAVAEGGSITITVPDGLATGSSALRYYRVYRSKVGGAADTETYMGAYPVNGATDTLIVDINENRPGTALTMILDMATLQWVKLLDFMRRPLAQTASAYPFLLMLFGALHMPTPKKNVILKNCARNL